MTKAEQQDLDALHRKLHERRRKMTVEQTLGFLKDVGLLDPEGRLARQYGGSGNETASSLLWSVENSDPVGNR